MAPGYSISGISLGNYGLSPVGTYSSFDYGMPSMMSMGAYDPSIFNAYGGYGGYGAYGGYGMMGMYNPAYMAQMQNHIESMQIDHAGAMHNKMLDNSVNNYRHTDASIINKVVSNGSVQQLLSRLYDEVHDGNQDGICQIFDSLRNQILVSYKDEIAARGREENPITTANQIIESLYYNYATAQNGGVSSDLISDIKKYGDGAGANGFMKGFRKDHHDKYVDETLNHCFGSPVDQRGSKEIRQGLGYAGGTVVSIVEKGAYGAVAGATVYGLGGGFAKLFGKVFPFASNIKYNGSTNGFFGKTLSKIFIGNGIKLSWKSCGQVALAVGLTAAIADTIWKLTDSKSNA